MNSIKGEFNYNLSEIKAKFIFIPPKKVDIKKAQADSA